jgi:hypothetical protein
MITPHSTYSFASSDFHAWFGGLLTLRLINPICLKSTGLYIENLEQKCATPFLRNGIPRLAKIFAVLIFLTGCLTLCSRGWAASSESATKTVQLGVYMVEMHDFDPKTSSFQADFWLWALTTPDMANWIESLDYPTGIRVDKLNSTEQEVDGKIWASTNVSGKFREDWHLKNFPLDRLHLRIPIEETSLDASNFRFSADHINSSAKDAILPAGWRLKGFSIQPSVHNYVTTLGNPSKPTYSSS